MRILKRSLHSGNFNAMELPISEEQYNEGVRMISDGFIAKCAFPTLDEKQHDFLLTGMTEQEWEELS